MSFNTTNIFRKGTALLLTALMVFTAVPQNAYADYDEETSVEETSIEETSAEETAAPTEAPTEPADTAAPEGAETPAEGDPTEAVVPEEEATAAPTEPATESTTETPTTQEPTEPEPVPVYGNVLLKAPQAGGAVTLKVKGHDDTEQTFSFRDGSVIRKDHGIETVAALNDMQQVLVFTEEVGTVVEVQITAKTGFKIAEYSAMTDTGTVLAKDGFIANELEEYRQELVITEADTIINAEYYELPVPTTEEETTEEQTTEKVTEEETEGVTEEITEKEAEETTSEDKSEEEGAEEPTTEEKTSEEVTTADPEETTEPVESVTEPETEKNPEEVTESESEELKEEETEEDTEVSTEEEGTTTDAETEDESESEKEDETEAEESESETETEAETEEPETEAPALFSGIDKDSVIDTYVLNTLDFSSKRLIVAWDADKILDPEHIVASYDGVFILQYEDEATAAYAFTYYYGKAYFADIDGIISIADGENGEQPSVAAIDEESNPLTELQTALAENTAVYSGKVIALIDTGVNGYAGNIVEAVSMIGDDTTDYQGHGTAMAGYITSQNPNARIISIKAIRDDGNGDVSAVYAAIRYAIDRGADIINLSISAVKKLDNASIVSIIDEAASQGIIVVGAAGNNGANAAFFIPGSIQSAYIIGAAQANGERLPSSNYGPSVDYNVIAEATSIAAAKFSGYVSLHGVTGPDNTLIFPTDYVYVAPVEPEVPEEPIPEEPEEPTIPIEDTALFQYFKENVKPILTDVRKAEMVDGLTNKFTFVDNDYWVDANNDGVVDLYDLYDNGTEDYLLHSYTKDSYVGFYDLDEYSNFLVAYLPIDSDKEYTFRSFDLAIENNGGQVVKDIYYYDNETKLLYVAKSFFKAPWEAGIIGSLRAQVVYTFDDGTVADLTKTVHVKAEIREEEPGILPAGLKLIDENIEVSMLDAESIRAQLYEKQFEDDLHITGIHVYINGASEEVDNSAIGFDPDGSFMLLYNMVSVSDILVVLEASKEGTPFTIAASVEEAIQTLNDSGLWLFTNAMELDSVDLLPAVGDRISFGSTTFDQNAYFSATSACGIGFEATGVSGVVAYTSGMASILNNLMANNNGDASTVIAKLNELRVLIATNTEGQSAQYRYTVGGAVYKESSPTSKVQIATIPNTQISLVCTHIVQAEGQAAFGSQYMDYQSASVFGKVIQVTDFDANGYATVYVGVGSDRVFPIGQSGYVQAQYNIARFRVHVEDKTGYVGVKKTVSGNSSAFVSAVYGVYSNEACTTKLTEINVTSLNQAFFTTDAAKLTDGTTYYIKEISVNPSDKFTVDPDPHPVKATTNKTDAAGSNVTNSEDKEINGYVGVKKTVSGNSSAFVSAVYGVYSNNACTNKLGEINVTSLNSAFFTSDSVKLTIGTTYYVKEISVNPSDKFTVDPNPHAVVASSNKTNAAGSNVTNSEDDEVPGYVGVVKKYSGGKAVGLTSAVYALYATNANAASDTSRMGTVTFTQSDITNGVSVLKTFANKLTIGNTYYVKEVSVAPATITKDPTIYEVTASTNTTSATAQNVAVSTDKLDTGKLAVQKVSANDMATKGNSCYNFEGIQFKVYTDPNCTQEAVNSDGNTFVLTTGATGKTNTVEVVVGTYYIKEVGTSIQGKGWEANGRNVGVTVVSDETTVRDFTNNPLNDPAGIVINKMDENGNVIQGADLSGAQFTIRFYAGQYTKANLPSSADATWVIQTKKVGNMYMAELSDGYKVSGDSAKYGITDTYYNIPLGTLTIEETKPAPGYTTEGSTLQLMGGNGSDATDGVILCNIVEENSMVVVKAGNQVDSNTDDGFGILVKETQIRGGVKFSKIDQPSNAAAPEGDAVLSDAEITIYAAETIADAKNQKTYSADQAVMVIKTNASGIATTGDHDLPSGKYYAKETTPSNGYLLNTTWKVSFEIGSTEAADGVIVDKTENVLPETPIKGGVRIKKQAVEKSGEINTEIDLSDVEFTIKNASENPVMVEGASYAKNTVICVLKTNAQGVAETAPNYLPYGTYTIQETATNDYMQLTDGEPKTFKITANGQIVEVDTANNQMTFENNPVKGGVAIPKYNTGGYDSDFTKVVFAIYNRTGKKVQVDGVTYANGAEITQISPVKEGDKWIAKTDPEYLPRGRYSFKEIATSEDCVLNEEEVYFEIVENGVYATTDANGKEILVGNNPKRAHLAFNKVAEDRPDDEDQGKAVPFLITNENTGEQHIIVTGADGSYNSQSYPHTSADDTNLNDSFIGHGLTEDDRIDFDQLQECGLWFGDMDYIVEEIGSLELGEGPVSYTMQELYSTSNRGYSMLKYRFTVTKNDQVAANYITLTNLENPSIATTAKGEATMEHVVLAYPKVYLENNPGTDTTTTIIDTVRCYNLVPGDKYTLKATFEYAPGDGTKINNNGIAVTGTTTFVAEAEDYQDVDVLLTFNADDTFVYGHEMFDLTGQTGVVFETLYSVKLHNGKEVEKEVADHKEILDEEQTIHFPKITSHAVDMFTKDNVGTINPDGSSVIVDTLAYENVVPDKTYYVVAKLYDKETGKDTGITHTTSFTATASAGTVDNTISFQGEEGKTYVCYERMYVNSVSDSNLVAIDEDIANEAQTVYFPSMKTVARDSSTEDHVGNAYEDKAVVDAIELGNLVPGKEYTVRGKLYVVETGAAVEADGKNTVEVEETFTAEEATKTLEFAYPLETTKHPDETIVIYSYLAHNDVDVLTHDDITDEDESVHYPEVLTTAKDGETDDHVGTVEKEATILDEVFYYNLIPSEAYTVSGRLINVTESEKQGKVVPLLDKDGKEITASATLAANSHPADGSVVLTFSFDSSLLAGETVVVFEDLLHKGIIVRTHSDLHDENQTIHYPEIRTSAKDGQTGDDVGTVGPTTIVDTVSYKNLIVGEKYTINGKLMDKATGKPLLVNGEEVTATSGEFTADKADGTIDLTFTLDASDLEDTTTVVFEKLFHPNAETGEPVEVHQHEDIKDNGQTVHFPKIRTHAVDGTTMDEVGTVAKQTTIIDEVSYDNLVIGREYTVSGILHQRDNETGEDLGELLVNGQKVVATRTFTAGTEEEGLTVTARDNTQLRVDGKVTLTYTLDSSALEGVTVVVFEDLIHNSITVTSHADIHDEKQSVHFPKIRTMAHDGLTQDEVGSVAPNAAEESMDSITDHVLYWNLVPGKQYKISGTLMDKDTGKELLIDGTKVTKSITFTAKETGSEGDAQYGYYSDDAKTSLNGTVDLTYTFDGSTLADKTLVVFEKLFHTNEETEEEIEVTSHEDLNDHDQTLHYPSIETNAYDGETEDHVGTVEEDAEIIDVVTFTNLVKGLEYTISGTVHKKDYITGEDLGTLKDAKGKEVKATATFIAGDTETYPDQKVTKEEEVNGRIRVSGTYTITFALDASLLEGETAVVFEDLLHNGVTVDVHGDITDEDQTIHYPKIRTIAVDTRTESQVGSIAGDIINELLGYKAGDKAVIIDTVRYWNLIPGMTYELDGTLMDKNAETAIQDADAPVTINPEAKDGESQVVFTVDTAKLTGVGTDEAEGVATVVFEKLYHGIDNAKDENGNVHPEDRVEVTRHEDFSDDDQSVYQANIKTVAIDAETKDNVGVISKNAQIIDTISFTQFVKGYEYTIQGVVRIHGTDIAVSQNEITFIAGEEAEGVTYLEIGGKNNNEVSGTISLTFDVDSTKLESQTVVVYEYVLVDDVVVTGHPVSTAEMARQSIHYPTGKTNATDNKTEAHTADAAAKTIITDKVYFQHLVAGKEYSVEGELMNKKTGKALGIAGSKASVTFIAGGEGTEVTDSVISTIDGVELVSGYVDIVFTIDTTALAGETVVAFETFKHNGVEIFFHKDLSDLCQNVRIPAISTSAKVKDLDEGSLYDTNGNLQDIVIVDTVKYQNLWTEAELKELAEQGRTIKGGEVKFERDGYVYTINEDATYTVTGILMVKETGEALKDQNGKEYTASTTFKPENPDGSVDVTFTINGKDFIDEDGVCLIEGKTLVVFEDLYLGKAPAEQPDEGGEEDDTPDKPDNHIGEHHDIEDDEQDIRIPKGRTHAVDTINKDALADGHDKDEDKPEVHEVLAAEDISITDRVTYENLHGGTEYTVKGTLMDKSTGKPALDDNGKEITAEKTFKTSGAYDDEVSGYVDIVFTFSGVKLAGRTIVAFERCEREGQEVFVHANLEDAPQTLFIPDLKTNVMFEDNGEDFHEGIADEEEHVITDVVTYTNLKAGQEYTVTGILMDKETEEPFLVDGKEITAKTTFVAGEDDEAKPDKDGRVSGKVELTFTFVTKTAEGKSLVAFETVLDNGKEVGVHADIEDADQTITFPKVRTTATDGLNGTHEQQASKTATIVDTVLYSNLHVGKKYHVEGVLMNKATGKPLTVEVPVKDEDGNVVKDKDGNIVTEKVRRRRGSTDIRA